MEEDYEDYEEKYGNDDDDDDEGGYESDKATF